MTRTAPRATFLKTKKERSLMWAVRVGVLEPHWKRVRPTRNALGKIDAKLNGTVFTREPKKLPKTKRWLVDLKQAAFLECDSFLTVWPILPNVTHFKPLFSVTHVSQCNPFFVSSDPRFSNVILFWAVWPLSAVWPILPIVTYVSQCDSFFQIWLIFHSVIHFSKSDLLFEMWPFCHSDPFSKCDSLFTQFDPFFTVTYFFKVLLYFTV